MKDLSAGASVCVPLQGRSSREGVGSINKKECFFFSGRYRAEGMYIYSAQSDGKIKSPLFFISNRK